MCVGGAAVPGGNLRAVVLFFWHSSKDHVDVLLAGGWMSAEPPESSLAVYTLQRYQ